MRYQVTHTTVYSATHPVSVCHNAAWLTPRESERQHLESHDILIDPRPSTIDRRSDWFGNQITQFSLNEGYKELRVTANSRVEVAAVSLPDTSPTWEEIVAQLSRHERPEDLEAFQFRCDSTRSRSSPEAAEYARKSFSAKRPLIEALTDLTSRVHADFEYDSRATTVSTPVDEVLQQRRGVCQDFAHVEIAMLRSLGLAARYVSGYVRTIPRAGRPRLIGADASHAWVSAYCGQLGWIDFDPTNDKFVSDEHITVAWGRDYADVTPLKGVYTGGGKHSLHVSVDVAPIDSATAASNLPTGAER